MIKIECPCAVAETLGTDPDLIHRRGGSDHGAVEFPAIPREYPLQERRFSESDGARIGYPLPWKLQAAGTYQSIPGPVVLANYVATSAQVAPSFGRGLSSATNVTVNVIEPGTLYGERLNQFDVRLSKIFTVGRLRAVGSFDLFNAFNTNAVLQQNNTYGTNGASWQVPQAVLAARLAKFTVQLNF